MNLVKNLCCWGTDYCKCQCIGLSRNQNIKLAYIIKILAIILLTSLIGRYKSDSPALIQTFGCNTNSGLPQNQGLCVRQQLTFHWFLALSFVHLLLLVCMLFRNQLSKITNEGIWMAKIVLIVGIGFMFMYLLPHGFINFMQLVSTYFVPVWYLIQNLIIVDLFYSIQNLFKQLGQKNPKFYLVKAFLAIIIILGAISVNVLSYAHHKATTDVLFISILNSIYIAVFLIVVLLKIVKGHSLFIYGLIMLYSNVVGYFLHCPASQYGQSIYPIIQIILVVICLLGILSSGSNKVRTKKSSLNEILALNTSRQEQDSRYVSSNKWIIFHLVFFIICLGLTWVIRQQGESFSYGQNKSNQQIKLFRIYRIIGWFLIMFVYIWTLVTAKMFPQQDFDELENYFKEFQLN